MSVAGLLLAAGAGRRYGMPKALASDASGEPFIRRAVATLRDGGCSEIVAVLGAGADEVIELPGVRRIVNPEWASGMGSSLRAGLGGLGGQDAVVVLLVDTPGITPAAVRRLASGATAATLRVATYGGEQGHPVVIGRDHWAGVAELAEGDVGARPYLRRHPPERVACDDVADGTDVDVPRA
ncbi:nucleotidyltransferase family protein [Actinocorallia longicatena]|uniref:NTP transferase domain-containing protein n=1 Tax=Actinocorallia longicatena TaxID=111803 RepID=A0ABP6QF74_9ACTN